MYLYTPPKAGAALVATGVLKDGLELLTLLRNKQVIF